MNTRSYPRFAISRDSLVASLALTMAAHATDINKASNTDALNIGTSWSGGNVPTSSDVAVWNNTVTAANATILGADLSWAGIRIANPGGAVTINTGNTLTLGASGIDMSAATQDLNLNNTVALGAAQAWNVNTGRTLTVAGAISGSGLTKSGAGTLTLTGANTLSGTTNVTAGTLLLNGSNYTTAAGSAIAVSGATLTLTDSVLSGSSNTYSLTGLSLTNSTLNVNPSTGSGDGAVKFTQKVDFSGTNTVTRSGGNFQRSIRFEGGISGSGAVTLNSSGASINAILIQGDTSGFTGTLTANTGNISIQSSSGWGNGANLVVNTAVTLNNGTTAMVTNRYSQANVSSDVNNATGALTVNTGGSLTTVANITVGALSGTGGTINMASGKTLTVGALGTADSFAGAIGASTAGFTKTGAGTMTLSGANLYTGATTIKQGTLKLNGTGGIASSSTIIVGDTTNSTAQLDVTTKTGGFTVGASQTLKGAGAVLGAVNVSGVLAPGNSIESLAAGNLAFSDGSTFAYELDSTPLGLNGDLADSSGTLSLSGTVNLTLTELSSGILTQGSKLTLISYTGGAPVYTGGLFTYLGNTLADDAVITLGGNQWQFNYNDSIGGTNFSSDQSNNNSFVTMTVVPEPSVALLGGLGVLGLLRRRRN